MIGEDHGATQAFLPTGRKTNCYYIVYNISEWIPIEHFDEVDTEMQPASQPDMTLKIDLFFY